MSELKSLAAVVISDSDRFRMEAKIALRNLEKGGGKANQITWNVLADLVRAGNHLDSSASELAKAVQDTTSGG